MTLGPKVIKKKSPEKPFTVMPNPNSTHGLNYKNRFAQDSGSPPKVITDILNTDEVAVIEGGSQTTEEMHNLQQKQPHYGENELSTIIEMQRELTCRSGKDVQPNTFVLNKRNCF